MSKELQEAVIIDGVRTAMENGRGNLQHLRVTDLGATPIRALLERTKVDPALVEDVAMGCAFPEAVQGMNIGRQIALKAGLPEECPAQTINRFCASSMQAVHSISDAIETGRIQCGIAAGVENMMAVEMGGFNPCFDPDLVESHNLYVNMGETAETLAKEGQISREEQDAFAINSHEKTLKAIETGKFNNEIIPVTLSDGTIIDKDNSPRKPDAEKMKTLKTPFDKDGTVTAATSSPVSVGASACLITSRKFAEENGLPIRAIIRSKATTGCPPRTMGEGPIKAVAKALELAGLTMDQMDAMELNEAFAAQSLYCIKEAGWDINKINLNGGAIALGHPLGASGVRIIVTLMNVLEQIDGKKAIASMCVGGGMGSATVIERP